MAEGLAEEILLASTPSPAAGRPGRPTPAAASTADSANRRRDRRRVEAKLKLPEAGDEATAFDDARAGQRIATGYVRVVYGDHGAYIECRPDQVEWALFEPRNLSAAYYDLYRAKPPGRAQVYLQKRGVEDRPNPPQGRDSRPNQRAEGYADYRPGLVYISVKQVTVLHQGAVAPRTYNAPAKGKPHVEVLKAALKGMHAVNVCSVLTRETRFLNDGKHRRFTGVAADAIGAAVGLPADCCLKASLWLDVAGAPAAVAVVPRGARVRQDVLESACGRGGLRMASDRQVEAAVGARLAEVLLPLHPPVVGCATFVCTEVLLRHRVALHALCGVIATVTPAELMRLAPCAAAVRLSEAGAGAEGAGARRAGASGPPALGADPSWRVFPDCCALAFGRLWRALGALGTRRRAIVA